MLERWREHNSIQEPTEFIFDREDRKENKKEIDSVFARAELETDSLHRYGIYKGCHYYPDKPP